jgi:hypothetical protein
VPIIGKSAIGVEQPPSARADASSAPKAKARLARSTPIRPKLPHHQISFSPTVLLQPPTRLFDRQIAAAFNPLSPETIKAGTANRTVGASM